MLPNLAKMANLAKVVILTKFSPRVLTIYYPAKKGPKMLANLSEVAILTKFQQGLDKSFD